MSFTSLPAGWTVRNKDGNFTGPPAQDDEDEAVAEDLEEQCLDIRPDSPGWEDTNAGDDVEEISVKSFFSDDVFPSAPAMVQHCQEKDGFNFREVITIQKLDFLQAVKLVNYIRSEVAKGKTLGNDLNVGDSKNWSDDKYLQPTMENDAMLFSLGEFEELASGDTASEEQSTADA
nr:putative protein arginine n-methyltransferase 3 [Quercus suber]